MLSSNVLDKIKIPIPHGWDAVESLCFRSLKYLSVVLFLGFFSAQQRIPISTAVAGQADRVYLDDYGDIYLESTLQGTLDKYNSTGKIRAHYFSPVPFQVLSLDNPLLIPLFLRTSQELYFLDEHLNPIQDAIQLSAYFGNVAALSFEDLRYIWILDDAKSTLSRFDYREKLIVSQSLFKGDLQAIKNFIVYQNHIFGLTENSLVVYDLQGNLKSETPLVESIGLQRRGNRFLVLFKDRVLEGELVDQPVLKEVFRQPDAKALSQTPLNTLVLQGDKLYLYTNKK